MLSHFRLFVTLWTVALQAPLFMGFSRQEYWSGQPFPSPGDLPDPGIKPRSPALHADPLPLSPQGNQSKGTKFQLYKLNKSQRSTTQHSGYHRLRNLQRGQILHCALITHKNNNKECGRKLFKMIHKFVAQIMVMISRGQIHLQIPQVLYINYIQFWHINHSSIK